MSICLFVCPLAYCKNRTFEFHQILCTCCLWPRLCPALQCDTLCRAGLWFVDDGTFSHIRANGRHNQRQDDMYVSSSSPGGGTGDEVCVSECIFFAVKNSRPSAEMTTIQVNARGSGAS